MALAYRVAELYKLYEVRRIRTDYGVIYLDFFDKQNRVWVRVKRKIPNRLKMWFSDSELVYDALTGHAADDFIVYRPGVWEDTIRETWKKEANRYREPWMP